MLLPAVAALSFSVYNLTSFEQQEKQQQAQLQSVRLAIESQSDHIKQLKIEFQNLANLPQKTVEYIPNTRTNKQQGDTSNKQVLNQFSKQLKIINKKLTVMDKQQQLLSSNIKQQAQTLSGLALSQRENNTDEPQQSVQVNQSSEEILAKIKHETEQKTQQLDQYWQQQTLVSDPWTQNTIIETKKAFENAKGINISNVSCSNRVCKMEITSTEAAEVSPEELLMMNDTASESESYTQTKINADGSESLILYLAKEGASLPEDLIN